MIIRRLEKRDILKLEEIYLRSPMKYVLPMLDSPELLESLVMVDENDEPHVMVSALKVAEMFLIMDHEWETPAFRAVAFSELFAEMRPRLEAMGVSNAYAFMGPSVPKGFDRLLHKLGARIMEWRCVKWIKGM
jgi:hypothetical protein